MEFYCGIEREFVLIEIKVKEALGSGIFLRIIINLKKILFSIYIISKQPNRLASSLLFFLFNMYEFFSYGANLRESIDIIINF